MDINKIRCSADNLLVQMAHHANRTEEEKTPGGIFIPRTAQTPKHNEAIEAVIVAVGPGRWNTRWIDHERGESDVGGTVFIPVDPSLKPGVRVLLSAAGAAGDRVYSDDYSEYRMVKAHCVEAVLED